MKWKQLILPELIMTQSTNHIIAIEKEQQLHVVHGMTFYDNINLTAGQLLARTEQNRESTEGFLKWIVRRNYVKFGIRIGLNK